MITFYGGNGKLYGIELDKDQFIFYDHSVRKRVSLFSLDDAGTRVGRIGIAVHNQYAIRVLLEEKSNADPYKAEEMARTFHEWFCGEESRQ